MQVTCDVESGLRYLLRIEVITGIEADSPFIGKLDVTVYIKGIQAEFVRIAHVLTINGLTGVFRNIETGTEVDRPRHLEYLIAVSIGSSLFLLLLRSAVLGSFPLHVTVFLRRGILVLALLLVILLTGEEVPYFLPRIIVHGPTERRTISRPTTETAIRPFRTVTGHHPSVLIKLVSISGKGRAHTQRITLAQLQTEIKAQVTPRTHLSSRVVTDTHTQIVNQAHLADRVILILELHFKVIGDIETDKPLLSSTWRTEHLTGIIGILHGIANAVLVFYIRVIIAKTGRSEIGCSAETDGGSDDVTYLYLLLLHKQWLVHTINFGIDTQTGTVVVYTVKTVGRIIHLLALLIVPVLLHLAGVPTLRIVYGRRHIEVLEQSKRGTYRNLMLHTVLPIAYQVLLEQQIVLRLDTVLHTASIANGNLLIPLFISHCMFTLERENGTQGNGHVR